MPISNLKRNTYMHVQRSMLGLGLGEREACACAHPRGRASSTAGRSSMQKWKLGHILLLHNYINTCYVRYQGARPC